MRVEVRSRVPGGDRLPDVLVELAQERTTVRELIRAAVAEQVRAWQADSSRCRALLDRQYLTDDDIRAQAATGVVRLPDRQHGVPDADAEVTRAWRAFERGTFALFIGGRQVDLLDEQVVLRLGEPVVFVRLTALVGG
ncbi:hypothetical protein Cme02nite_07940 [Catellatospora methionotrophica]|uniref:Uncharacterized protein n=1 Tax=Catellatospora methionotrophica TaxID=121620 RepID=A0A8J3L0R9_9ACTN|nr:hypothetical protein [Catellatospora methionotrophica]GIG12462.1 hypothetical protein Cme02nite_07940 [Catellatospora methionotrophica]